MIETTTSRCTPARSPAACRLRAEAVKNAVACCSSGDDHGVHAAQGLVEALAGDDVDPGRAGHRHRVVPALAQDVHHVASEAPGGAGDGDTLLQVHRCSMRRPAGVCHAGRRCSVSAMTDRATRT
jgi:hypothetical protein